MALPSAAVRALVGELADLAGGGDVVEYQFEVLRDPEILPAAERHRSGTAGGQRR